MKKLFLLLCLIIPFNVFAMTITDDTTQVHYIVDPEYPPIEQSNNFIFTNLTQNFMITPITYSLTSNIKFDSITNKYYVENSKSCTSRFYNYSNPNHTGCDFSNTFPVFRGLTFSTYIYNDSPQTITTNVPYSVLIKLSKGNNGTWHGSLREEDFSLKINGSYGGSTFDLTDYISSYSIEFDPSVNSAYNDSSQNPRYANSAYILLNFEMATIPYNSQSFYPIFTLTTFDYTGETIDIDDQTYQVVSSPKHILDSSSGSVQVTHVSFLRDSLVEVVGTYDPLNDNYESGMSYYEGLDYLTETDEEILTGGVEECDSLDVSCHVRNLTKRVENLFVRLGNLIHSISDLIVNGIKKLFVPSEQTISNFFSNMYLTTQKKFGLLFYPVEVFQDFVSRFQNLERTSTINYEGYTLPLLDNNIKIIPEIHFDFDTYLKDESFINYYNLILLFTNSFLIFGLIRFLANFESAIIGGEDK